MSSAPEWKYVSLRCYLAYLKRNEFRKGALVGQKPEHASLVKCDRSTMTQTDLDNGRLAVVIGVAPLRPAEFVIFRIGQWTADRND
jgi:phage tail sheath protein FI